MTLALGRVRIGCRCDGVAVSNPSVAAVNHSLTATKVGQDLLGPRLGLGLRVVVRADALGAGLSHIPASFRVRYDVSASCHDYSFPDLNTTIQTTVGADLDGPP